MDPAKDRAWDFLRLQLESPEAQILHPRYRGAAEDLFLLVIIRKRHMSYSLNSLKRVI